MSDIRGSPPVVIPGTSNGVVSSSGLTGNTTGNSIAAGFVGEVISNTSSTAVTTTAAILASITVTPGVWLVSAAVVSSDTGSGTTFRLGITTASSTTYGTTADVQMRTGAVASNGSTGGSVGPTLVKISSGTGNVTYNVIATASTANFNLSVSYIQAVRIA